jgi:hypothetical protein
MTTDFAVPRKALSGESGRRPSAAGLIALQVAYVLFLPLWFLVAVVSVMGVANAEGAVVPVVLSVVWAYPLVLLVGVTMAWVSRARRWSRATWLWTLLPAPWVLSCGALLLYAALS